MGSHGYRAGMLLAAGMMAMASVATAPISTAPPEPGGRRKLRGGSRVHRMHDEATIAKPKSESLQRLLRRAR